MQETIAQNKTKINLFESNSMKTLKSIHGFLNFSAKQCL